MRRGWALAVGLWLSLAPMAAVHAQEGETLSLALPAGTPPDGSAGTVQFIGTATVLIRFQGLTILTDPNFLRKGGEVHLGYGVGSKRLTSPGVDFDNLPPIDLVVLSHMHDDHFDKLVQEKLPRTTPIVTNKEASENLKRIGFTNTYALSRWDRLDVQKGGARLRVTSLPARHGGPGVTAVLPSVMGAMLDFGADPAAPDYRIYISGDTMVYDELNAIPQRFPDIDLALLHLGGMHMLGMFQVTMDGGDGVRLMQLVRPRKAIPLHQDDYDVYQSPPGDFAGEAQAAGLAPQVAFLRHGETYSFTARQAAAQ
ncbi:MAG: MBL fold metallo-hydrolase [Telluria sp.]